jgi:Protein of unknown function (DUF3306)
MSESENFLSRWSRLKRESGSEESGVDEKRTADALPGADMPSSPAFDPACLPPIESIVADSDIRLFLQACVPAELTRAALRCAWIADPAIRDFIGIAESQWDFNDPATIPGFGSLGATDYARNLAARALGSLSSAEGAPESSSVVEQPASMNTDPKYCEPVDEGGQVLRLPTDSFHDADPEITSVESVAQRDASEASLGPPARRSHGGALPK